MSEIANRTKIRGNPQTLKNCKSHMKPRFRYTKTATRTLNRSSKQRAPSEILEYVLPGYDIVKFGPKGSFWGICIENTPQERFFKRENEQILA